MAEARAVLTVTRASRDTVRALSFQLTGIVGRQVTVSETLAALCSYVRDVAPAELAGHVPAPDPTTDAPDPTDPTEGGTT